MLIVEKKRVYYHQSGLTTPHLPRGARAEERHHNTHGRSLEIIDPRIPATAGTKPAGFASTRQPLLAPNAKQRREVLGWHERGARGGCAHFTNTRFRITIDPRIPAMPGRRTPGFHLPGRHRMMGELNFTKEPLVRRSSASCAYFFLHMTDSFDWHKGGGSKGPRKQRRNTGTRAALIVSINRATTTPALAARLRASA